MSRLETRQWKARADTLYDTIVELVNHGALQRMPEHLVHKTMGQITEFAVACHRHQKEKPNENK